MSFTSMTYLLFVAGAAVVYYGIPKKLRRYQYLVLLIFSCIFYLSNGPKLIAFLLFTTLTTYGFARGLDTLAFKRKQTDRSDREGRKRLDKKRRILLVTCLVLNFGVLFFLKYLPMQSVILPLGISFYTFQAMGYLIDVYWGKYPAERKLSRFLLFLSFFPQILQGPIGRYDRLMPQLVSTEGHSFDLRRAEHAAQRMLWGYFLKFVIADRAGLAVQMVTDNYLNYSGTWYVVTALMYSLQLYGDFAGGMDVVIGTAELFGITLDENFRRPYFSVSITDFWHRWHITLGTWMKDYVFYPLSISRAMRNLGKHARRKIGKKGSVILQATIVNLVVFLVVGIWHGKGAKYLVYGLYNGVIISLEAIFNTMRASKKKPVHLLQILITFLLVNISWFWDFPPTFSQGNYMLWHSLTDFHISELNGSMFAAFGFSSRTLLAAVAVLFVKSILEERGVDVREAIDHTCRPVRWLLYYALLFGVLVFGVNGVAGGFIYAQF